MISAEIA